LSDRRLGCARVSPRQGGLHLALTRKRWFPIGRMLQMLPDFTTATSAHARRDSKAVHCLSGDLRQIRPIRKTTLSDNWHTRFVCLRELSLDSLETLERLP